MRLLIIALFSGVSLITMAETSGGALTPGSNAPVVIVPQNSPTPINPNTIKVFDDAFFNGVGKQTTNSDEPQYNSKQKAEWLRKCEPLRETDYTAFKKCFESEKDVSIRDLEQSREVVQRKQALPLKNAPNLVEDNKRIPNGFDED